MDGQNFGNSLRKLWIKFRRSSRAPAKRKFYIGLCVAVYVVVSLLGRFLTASNFCDVLYLTLSLCTNQNQ